MVTGMPSLVEIMGEALSVVGWVQGSGVKRGGGRLEGKLLQP